MKIAFIHQGGPEMATYRFRCDIPSEALKALGHEVTINSGEADVVVFSKPMLTDYDIAQDVKKQGARVVVDIADDHLTHPLIGPMYSQMIKLADKLVSPTQNMAERVYRISGVLPEVIPDPYAEDLQEPHAQGDKLLWFGHMVNLKDLTPWKPLLNGIRILTGPRPHVNPKPHKNLAQSGPVWQEHYVEWSREAQKEELANANIVVLPSRQGAEYKSSHRLLDAVRGGCFVVAALHPSYEEFKKMVWTGDIKAGLDFARAFQDELNERVTEAQAYIEKTYSPAVIGRRWAQVLA